MDQDRSGEEGLLELVEGFLGRWSPGQRLRPAFEKRSEGCTEETVVVDEATVEISKVL